MLKNIPKLAIIALMLFAGSVQAQLNFAPKVDYATDNNPSSIAIGDLNGDGRPDMVTANNGSGNISVLTSSGMGTFGTKVDYSTGSRPSSVAIGDLNGDGFLDLAVAIGNDATVSVFTNTGIGTFGTAVNYATGSAPTCVAIGDLNGDGFLDLAVTNRIDNSISVLTNTGNGTFGSKVDYPTGSGPFSVAIGDFNGDDKPDLATANYNVGTISVLTSTGLGTFGAKVDYPTGNNPISIAIGDLNGDGRPDLATANFDYGFGNTISVLTNTGIGTFGAKLDYTTGSRPYSVAIGDLNGDDKPDLAVTNGNDRTVSVLTNTGMGSFGTKVDYSTGINPVYVAIADMNGDDKLDLAVANAGVRTVSVLINTSTLTSQFVTTWDLSKNNQNISEINFQITSSSNVKYSWETMPLATASGVGTITGNSAVISGLPSGEKIRLRLSPTHLKSINVYSGGGTYTNLVDIENWGAVKWTTFESAFRGCSNLNISATDVPNLTTVTNTSLMFAECTLLNSPTNIGTWNMSAVTNMESMFEVATNFNQPIGSWNTAAVTKMNYLFYQASSFNQSIGGWNTGAVTDMKFMFYEASLFNQSIGGWNTSAVTDINSMFYGASAFNQPIGSWNTSNVNNMRDMFSSATVFNQPIGNWNTNNVTNMRNMFSTATGFNQSIGNWNTGSATDMRGMFKNATAFDQNIGFWGAKLKSNVNLTNMLDNSGLSVANYSATLKGFSVTTATGRTLGALGLKYCSSLSARNTLTSTGLGGKSWNIVGDMVSTVPSTIIVTQPISQIIQPSTTANLSISATGDNLMYLWSSNETVSAISSKPAGIYTVTVSGTCGSVVSNAATIVGLNLSTVTISGASANGSLTSATNITISGTGFVNGATITVNGIAISNFTVVNGTSITATIPAGTLLASNNIILVQNPNQIASANTVVTIVDVTLGVNSTLTINNLPLTIFPNPSTGRVNITSQAVGTLLVFSAQGQVVGNYELKESTTELDLQLPKGLYLVKLGNQATKLIIE